MFCFKVCHSIFEVSLSAEEILTVLQEVRLELWSIALVLLMQNDSSFSKTFLSNCLKPKQLVFFRKAQAEVRRAKHTSNSDKEDSKENASPTFVQRLKGRVLK